MRDCKLVHTKVQTNVLELLGVEDANAAFEQEQVHEEYVEENLDSYYAQGLINGVIAGLGDGRDKKKRRKLPKERLATIPEFAFEEILGDFELRDDGSKVQQREGRHQVDRTGHRVNKMGYLIDPASNVVKRDG